MKFLSILIILNFSFSYSQQKIAVSKDSLVYRFKNCDEGKIEAKVDFEKGIYLNLSYGLVAEINPKSNEFVAAYRKEKYGIESKNGGCVVSDYTECYSQTMDDLVLAKFGKDFYEKSLEEAKKLYSK